MKMTPAYFGKMLPGPEPLRNLDFAPANGTSGRAYPFSRTDQTPLAGCVWGRARPFPLVLLGLCILTVGLVGCNRPQSAAHPFPPTSVTVSKPAQKEVVNWSEFTGRTAAVNLVNVTARVSGYIVSIPFKEGDIVRKGALLYQVDPRPYQDA